MSATPPRASAPAASPSPTSPPPAPPAPSARRSAAPASPSRPSPPHRDAAIDFAYWVASGPVQRGPYAAAGGQPGHAAAWEDAAVNAATGDFYRATRATLEAAWVRPRHDGYMAFQQAASARLDAALRAEAAPEAVVDDLNRLFAASFPSTRCGTRPGRET